MILKPLTDLYGQSGEFQTLKPGETKAAIEGVSPASQSFIIGTVFSADPRQTLVVTPTVQKMNDVMADLSAFIDAEDLYPVPPWETLPYESVSPPERIERERITSLFALLAGKKAVFVTSIESLARLLPAPSALVSRGFLLAAGNEYPQDALLEQLVAYGYTREQRVEGFGHFAVKGGIVDVYLPQFANPVRCDFFGDTLDSIREFDAITQISLGSLQEVTLFPRREIPCDEAGINLLREKLTAIAVGKQELPFWTTANETPGHDTVPGIEDYFPLIMDSARLESYLDKNASIIILDTLECRTALMSLESTFRELYQRKLSSQVILTPEELIDPGVLERISRTVLSIQPYTASVESLKWNIKSIPSFQGRIKQVREEIDGRLAEGWRVVMTTAFDGQARRLGDLFRDQKPDCDFDNLGNSPFDIVISPLGAGCEIAAAKIYILTDHEIFGKSYRKKQSFKKRRSRPIDSFLELNPGDHVVHVNHGIGLFTGIERMSAGGIERDFLQISYAGDDRLYVPLDQITLVQKYIGLEGKAPRIDSLGKKSAWNKIKKRVQESVEEIAQALMKIYSKRSAHKGFMYPPDTVWQEEFEAKFEYEETPDQITAIEDVKDDMESGKPMDRLVCGDVGFGKTEVAIRAAFKAVMAGKQVAVLVPTTVLAMQHLATFRKRFTDYPIEIESISRFKTQTEIRRIRERLTLGEIDIIIGTHALLSESIVIKNFGLLVIDEEQKFGVRHKEQLKKFRAMVDVLTLSATPIPRTLHLSLASIRDLSIIATPPENRQSIETYVMEENPDILRRAILKEIERDGQVFFVHNRVQTIDVQAALLEELVPEATYSVAHGQMHEHELEEIIIAFLNREFDVLISTTIIESGIDMPNVNTIIINRADTFGLSQLYQLKGRVGRSERRAYAYLFYPPHVSLTEEAQKRLQVISEYTELGSGFRVAMKDLEIRGAGNIIGHEQSGSIMEVGFDLYTAMLEDAVRVARGEKPDTHFRTPVFINTDIFIPDAYIADQAQKIEFYKRFEACESEEEVHQLTAELVDRFGPPPGIVTTLIALEQLRVMASRLAIDEIIEDSRYIRIKITGQSGINSEKLVQFLATDGRLSFDPQDTEILRFKPHEKAAEKKIEELKNFLQQL